MAIIVSWVEAEEIFTNTRKTKASPLPDINGQEIGNRRRRLFFSFFQNGLMFKEISSRQIFQFASFTKVTDASPRLGTTPSARCGFCSLKNTSFLFPFKHNGRSNGLQVLAEAETDRFGG